MTLKNIETWHQRARPAPTEANFGVQLGCHLEEFAEMLRVLSDEGGQVYALATEVEYLASLMKRGDLLPVIRDRQELLDSLADQVVTAVGVGHCAGMKTAEACERVNESNWSKYDSLGQPMFNANGKIMKGPNYQAPDLTGLF